MNKRKSAADDEEVQTCKKLKLNWLIAAGDADTPSCGPLSSTPSASTAPKSSASTSAPTGVAEAHDAHDTNGAHGHPVVEPRIKRKATDDAQLSQSGEPEAKRAKAISNSGESTRRARSPMRLHFKWKDYIPQPEKEIGASQRQWYAAPREVQELFAAYPQTDSEDEAERFGLPSPSSSAHGGAVQQPAAVPGTHHLNSIPRPSSPPEMAVSRNAIYMSQPMGGEASGSGSTHISVPSSPEQRSASRSSSASPSTKSADASSSRRRPNKGKSPATHSRVEKRGTPQSPEKRTPPLNKRKQKKSNGRRQPTHEESGPGAKNLEGFLRSTRSSRRSGKCELWHLGDDGVATRSVNKR